MEIFLSKNRLFSMAIIISALWFVGAPAYIEALADEEGLSAKVVQDVLKAVYENDNQSLIRLIKQTNGNVVNARVVIGDGNVGEGFLVKDFNGKVVSVRVVLDKKGDGEGLLLIAAAKGNVDIVRTLLSYGADVNEAGYGGVGALDHAAVYCDSELAKLLLMSGADLNKKDDLGVTPLMSSAIIGCKNVLLELLKYGANKLIKSNEGRTALDYAKIKGRGEIIKLLEAAPIGSDPKAR